MQQKLIRVYYFFPIVFMMFFHKNELKNWIFEWDLKKLCLKTFFYREIM